MTAPKLDKPAPDCAVQATSGRELKLSELRGKKVVLYFYPKDNTPGCTTEGQDFRNQAEAFAAVNCEVLGVSRDSLKSHENFRSKHAFNFDLITDPDEKLCRLYDVIKEKNMYGRKVMGIERSTFLIDEAGVLRAEWRKVKVAGHVAEVLEAAQAL